MSCDRVTLNYTAVYCCTRYTIATILNETAAAAAAAAAAATAAAPAEGQCLPRSSQFVVAVCLHGV